MLRIGTDGGRLILSYDIPTDRDGLRRYMRARRSALLVSERLDAAHALEAILRPRLCTAGVHKVAAYYAVRGEIDPSAVANLCHQQDIQFHLPVMRSEDQILDFAPWNIDTPLRAVRHGLYEPDVPAALRQPVTAMDWLLIPLTAFDRKGNRLGSGGGWYDRTLAALRDLRAPNRPFLLGLAYSFQETEGIQTASWDVPLDAIATEREWIDIPAQA